nr:MAG TPA: hypothetical protein [Inoviridae sp.]
MYVCSAVVDNVCQQWVNVSEAFGLSVTDGVRVGSMFFGLCMFAWLGRMVIKSLKL